MFQTNPIHTDTIVFSQWSRKSYAVFASLKKVVRIARLSIDICLSSLLNVPAVICLLSLLVNSAEEDDNTAIDEQYVNLQLSLAVMPLISTHKETYSSDNINNLQYRNPFFAPCKVWVFSFKTSLYD